GAPLGRERVACVRAVQGACHHALVRDVLDQHGLSGLREIRWWGAEVEHLPTIGASRGRCHVVLLSISQVSSSASQRNARRPGAKQYSPPRVTTNGGRLSSRRRIGRRGIVNTPEPSFAPTSGSLSVGAPTKMPSFSHCVLTNSNWRFRCAPAKTKMMPRSTPSSSST